MNRIKNLSIGDEGFVFDPTTGESFLTNKTGCTILQILQAGQLGENGVIQRLISDFAVSSEVASRDVADFMQRLTAMRLV